MNSRFDHVIEELVELGILEASADKFNYFNFCPVEVIQIGLEVNFFEIVVKEFKSVTRE